MTEAYIYVRLAGWKYEWRTVTVNNLEEALEMGRKMPDVISVLEASWSRGGVPT